MKKTLRWALWLMFLCPFGYLFMIWNTLPEKVPLHFNIEGKADGFGSRGELLAMVVFLVVLNIGTFYLVTNAHKLDPKKKYSQENKPGIRKLGVSVSIFLTTTILFVIYSVSKGAQGIAAKGDFVFSAVGLLYCVIGNYMYNIKQNNFAGIRIPTTLRDEENWRKTHQMAGKLWFWGGLVTAVLCFFLPSKQGFIVFISITVLLTAIPIVFSLKLDRKKENRSAP